MKRLNLYIGLSSSSPSLTLQKLPSSRAKSPALFNYTVPPGRGAIRVRAGKRAYRVARVKVTIARYAVQSRLRSDNTRLSYRSLVGLCAARFSDGPRNSRMFRGRDFVERVDLGGSTSRLWRCVKLVSLRPMVRRSRTFDGLTIENVNEDEKEEKEATKADSRQRGISARISRARAVIVARSVAFKQITHKCVFFRILQITTSSATRRVVRAKNAKCFIHCCAPPSLARAERSILSRASSIAQVKECYSCRRYSSCYCTNFRD